MTSILKWGSTFEANPKIQVIWVVAGQAFTSKRAATNHLFSVNRMGAKHELKTYSRDLYASAKAIQETAKLIKSAKVSTGDEKETPDTKSAKVSTDNEEETPDKTIVESTPVVETPALTKKKASVRKGRKTAPKKATTTDTATETKP